VCVCVDMIVIVVVSKKYFFAPNMILLQCLEPFYISDPHHHT
jgi:hypothetical protein